MTEYRLVLHPIDANFVFTNVAQLGKELREIGLIKDALSKNRFLTGERFLELISFLGCSPFVELSPTPSDEAMERRFDFCHIQIPEPTTIAHLIFGKNVKVPRCPTCKKTIITWKELIANRKQAFDGYKVPCHNCNIELSPDQLNWRKSACFVRSSINIFNVYESEAIPSVELLATLERTTRTPWSFVYVRD
jgi:hypothetical protein